MKRFGGWLSSGKNAAHLGASKSLTAIDEPAALQDAMKSAALIMNDEVEQAETELGNVTSPFHKLGHATCMFIRATIGFEKDIMEQASIRLAEVEEAAGEHHKRAVRDPSTAHQSKIYPAGSEYALVHAEAQLMQAVVGVLTESLTESLRGFYKLRRAFATLQEIAAVEEKYLSGAPMTGQDDQDTIVNGSGVMTPADDSDEEDFEDAAEELDQPTPLHYQGHVDLPDVSKLDLKEGTGDMTAPVRSPPYTKDTPEAQDEDADFASLTSDPIDHFIHSGTALCYGLLQLLLSMIPPAFGKLLSILSFRGDRENGFRLLWKATAAKKNVNGAFAGLIVLGFHNAAIGLCDIHGAEAYPRARLRQLLQDMRTLYPKSIMWILEEARMAALDRQLDRAHDIMTATTVTTSTLRQMNALRLFELALNAMFRHNYQECADLFLQCVELNNWSHGMYYYIAGCCHIELYRSNPSNNTENKTRAKELLLKATAHTGKRRLMARQLPLDVFINRKITKWQAHAKLQNCDLIDAVGVSPIEEMIYFWAGYRRMSPSHLETSLDRLSGEYDHRQIDERAVQNLLRATCLRCLGKFAEARKVLEEDVLCYSWQELRAIEGSDAWALPVGFYEMACCWWGEANADGSGRKELLKKCSEDLSKVEKWEGGFELEARIGMKIKTARITLEGEGV